MARTSRSSGGRPDAVVLTAPIGLTDEPLSGTLQQAVVGVGFAGELLTVAPSVLEAHLYGAGSASDYSISQFYTEASYGQFAVTGRVAGTVTLQESSGAYIGTRDDGTFPGIADRLETLILDIVQAADSTIDFAPFVDPADPAHRVAALVILHAGPSGNCPDDQSHVWPHRFSLTGLRGAPYVTRSRTASGAAIVIDDYIIQGTAACSGAGLAGNGTVIHETGHLIGLPDLYDTESTTSGGPVGYWDLMATGLYNSDRVPAQLGAWSRAFLGWAEVTVAAPGTSDTLRLSLTPVQGDGAVVAVPYAAPTGQPPAEYLLLEHRTRTGSDVHAPAEGLAAWYVDAARIQDQLLANTVNASGALGVALLQADGRRDLEAGRNSGDATDLFGGATTLPTELSAHTTPSLPTAGTSAPGFAVRAIARPSATLVTAEVMRDAAPTPVIALLPDTLPTFIRGMPALVTFAVGDTALAARATTWRTTSPSALAAVGLTVSAEGVLSGTVTGSDTATEATIEATVAAASDDAPVVIARSYTVRILNPAPVPIETLVDAVLDPIAASLLPASARYYDAIGNRNGSVDLGDVVLALRAGAFTTAETAALRAALPTVGGGARP